MIFTRNSEAQSRPLSSPWPILDIDVMTIDEDASTTEALRAELSLQEASEWTRHCVQRHLI